MEYKFDDIKADAKKIDAEAGKIVSPFVEKVLDEVVAPFCKKWSLTYRYALGIYLFCTSDEDELIMSLGQRPEDAKKKDFPKEFYQEALAVRDIIELTVCDKSIYQYIESVRF